MKPVLRTVWRVVTAVCILSISVYTVEAQTGSVNGEWRTYGGDLGSTRYAPLDQINADNFDELEMVWRFNTANLGPNPDFNYQATPLMVGGTLYTTAGSRRDVVALDASTGELLWVYRLDEGERGANAIRRMSGRGVASAACNPRGFYEKIFPVVAKKDSKSTVKCSAFVGGCETTRGS